MNTYVDSFVRNAYKRTSLMVIFAFTVICGHALSFNFDELSDKSKNLYTAYEMAECEDEAILWGAFVSSLNQQSNASAMMMEVTECQRVSSCEGDAEQYSNGGNLQVCGDPALTDLDLGVQAGNLNVTAMNFGGWMIPAGATIISADIQFTALSASVGPAAFTIRGEAADNPPLYSTTNDVVSRVGTAASVPWSPGSWFNQGDAGAAQQTPDLSAIIQEIVNRPGYVMGNNIALFLSGKGERQAYDFGNDPSLAPELCITYEVPEENTATCDGCPDISVVSLDGVPNFPTVDLLNLCSSPDTASILIYNGGECMLQNVELTLTLDSGLSYGGFVFMDMNSTGMGTVMPSDLSDLTVPVFTISEIDSAAAYIVNVAIQADCDVDTESEQDINFDAEVSFTYNDSNGSTPTCTEGITEVGAYNSGIRVPVLNVRTVSPQDLDLTQSDTPGCQTLTVSQDGIQAFLDEYQFTIQGLDQSLYTLESITINGQSVPAGDISYDASSMTAAVLVTGNYMTQANNNMLFDADELMTIEICYSVEGCVDDANFLTYSAFYGCNNKICGDVSSMQGALDFKPDFGAGVSAMSANVMYGGICGADMSYDIVLTSQNSDPLDGLWEDLIIKYKACLLNNTELTSLQINGTAVPTDVWSIADGTLTIDLTQNTTDFDGAGGLTDEDGDGIFDDLPGGNTITISTTIDIGCFGAGTGCSALACSLTNVEVNGKRNCGQDFQQFASLAGEGSISFFYGAEGSTTNSVPTPGYGIPITEVVETTCDVWAPTVNGYEFSYDFGLNNIAPCMGGDIYMEIYVSANGNRINNIRYTEGSATYNGAPVPGASGMWDIIDIGGGLTDTVGYILTIPAGDPMATTHDYFFNLDYQGDCFPWDYTYLSYSVIEECSACDGDEPCKITRACDTAQSYIRWRGCDCVCAIRPYVEEAYRTQYGYADKAMTIPLTKDDVPEQDRNRYLPGDTMYARVAYEILDADVFYEADGRWGFRIRDYNWDSPLRIDKNSSQFLNWYHYDESEGTTTAIGLPDCFDNYPDATRDNTYYPGIRMSNMGVDRTTGTWSTTAQQTAYGACLSDPDINPEFPAESAANYEMTNHTCSDATTYTLFDVYWGIPDECGTDEGFGASAWEDDFSEDAHNTCHADFLAQYPLADGDIIYFDYNFVMMENPNVELAMLNGVTPITNNYLYPSAYVSKIDEATCRNSQVAGSCPTSFPFEGHLPGPVTVAPDVLVTDCDIDVEYSFQLQNGTPEVDVAAGELPWYENEYRPFMATEYLQFSFPNNMVYQDNGVIVMPDGSEVPLPNQYIDQTAGNLTCITDASGGLCCVAADNNELASVRINDADYNLAKQIPYYRGDQSCNPGTNDLCNINAFVHKGGDPFPLLPVGGQEQCDYKLKYQLSALCPEDVMSSDFQLSYQFANPYLPTLSTNNTYQSCGLLDGNIYPGSHIERYIDNPYGSSCDSYPGVAPSGCLVYWGNININPDCSPEAVNPNRQTGTSVTTPDNFIDNSLDFPPLLTDVDRLLIPDEAGVNEFNEYTVCAGTTGGGATHENVVTSIEIPNSIQFIDVQTTGGTSLPWTLAQTTPTSNIYAVENSDLAPGECETIVIVTELLFCPVGLDVETRICASTVSGCLEPAKAAALNAAGEGCDVVDACYEYVAEEADLQVEWDPQPSGEYGLCDVIDMGVRIKNVKPAVLTNLTLDFWFPAGLNYVPGSWQACYPGGPTNVGACVSIPDPTAMPGENLVFGENYSYDDMSVINSFINSQGLPGINASQDSNRLQILFQAETVCNEFVSGTSVYHQAWAADPCEATVQSMFVDSDPIIIENANPNDFAQFFVFAEPAQANCGEEATLVLTYLNISPFGESQESLVCIDLETETFDYMSGSVMWLAPTSHTPTITETMNGTITEVCFDIPDGIGPGEAFQISIDFSIPEDIDCGGQDLGVAVTSEIMDQSCAAQGEMCSVYVLNSVNPQITVDFLPPLNVNDQTLMTKCPNADGTVELCYDVELENPGAFYNGDVMIKLIRDVNQNGIIDDPIIDPEIANMSHFVLLNTGETTILSGCFTVSDAESCPVFLMIMQDTDCVCDALDYYYDSIEPAITDDMQTEYTLCTGIPFGIEQCPSWDYAVSPAAGASVVPNAANDSLYITINPGFGVTAPVVLTVTSQSGGCAEFNFPIELYSLADFTFGPFAGVDACSDGCQQLSLNIPSQYESSVTVEWFPNQYLDDNTSLTPTICDPQADVDYFVQLTFTNPDGSTCMYDATFPVVVDDPLVEEVIENGNLCNETQATLTAPSGYSTYTWIRINPDGTETVVATGSDNTYTATEEARYYVTYTNLGQTCANRSNEFIVNECILLDKSITSIVPTGNPNEYMVSYTINVENPGTLPGEYDLYDVPGFDTDIVASSASYSSNAPGVAGGGLALPAPAAPGWLLGSDVVINATTTHTYTVNFIVTIDLADGTVGDDMYTSCGQGSGPANAGPGEGLYNEASLDLDDDPTTPEQEDDDCGELPYLTLEKNHVSTVETSLNCYDVTYQIYVENSGGADGQYDLTDDPNFDDDFQITAAIYTTDAVGNPGGSLPTTTSFYTLANDQAIAPGKIDEYVIVIGVCLDLEDPASPGDETYTECGSATPGSPTNGEGLYNIAGLDVNNDGTTDLTDDACDDVPYLVLTKELIGMEAIQADGSFNVTYKITVENLGGGDGEYDLFDLPQPDDDITFNSASFTSDVPSSGTLPTTIPASPGWVLATDEAIAGFGKHCYTVSTNVSIDLFDGVVGDDTYTECGEGGEDPGEAGEGLFNEALLDANNDGTIDLIDDTCGDISDLMMTKDLVSVSEQKADLSYDVTYKVTVTNFAGSTGTYDLYDLPVFDSDIVINSASYTSDIPSSGTLSAVPPAAPGWVLADDQTIGSMGVHCFTIIVNVSMDLLADVPVGDNDYTACGEGTGGVAGPGQGLYNIASLDDNNDGVIDDDDDACGDLPFLVLTKTHTSTTETSLNCYDVVYTVTVENIGGAPGTYDLVDDPMIDADFTINSAGYTTDAVGNPNNALAPNPSTYELADDQAIAAGKLDTYTVTINVCLDLEDGGAVDGGNDIYDGSCGTANGPTDPTSGEGLYNEATLDTNNDGTPDQEAEACDDVPYFLLDKEQLSATEQPDGTWNIVYKITVENIGGAAGQYDLFDEPQFDNDINILSASYTSDAGPSNPALPIAVPTGGWVLANDQAIPAFDMDMYTLTVNVDYDFFDAAAPGDDTYTYCGDGGAEPGEAGEGLFNEATLDTNNDGTIDLVDETCEDLEVYDLALTKVTTSTGPYTWGDPVTFEIEVYNQAPMTVTDIEVTDYIPCGFTYLSSNDPTWTYDAATGNATTTLAGPLAAGQTATVLITLELTQCYTDPADAWTNHAEISAFEDEFGDPATDVDSTPDDTNGNDPGGNPDGNSDDVVDGDGTGTPGDDNPNTDEDDHDPEFVEIFDLALTKTITNEGPYNWLDDITFDINVFNQGNEFADNIVITDYFPSCFTLNDSDWTDNGNSTASILLSVANGGLTAPLAPGQSITVPITLTVGVCSSQEQINFAEITSATDEDGNPEADVDSTPDATNGNDAGGEEDTGSDDVTGGDGTGTPGDEDPLTDEDDHDPEDVIVEVPIWDLALIKTLSLGQPNPVEIGDQVSFDIQVLNQGTESVDNIVITDYIPACLSLADPDWTDNGDGTASIELSVANGGLAGPLLPGQQVLVDIIFTVDACASGTLMNWAEISDFTDEFGDPQEDDDSTPDDNPDNDFFGGDDTVDEDGMNGGDEDDHDPADITVIDPVNDQFDLALTKTLSAGQAANVGNGATVTFDITVVNQGNVAADNIELVDYMPACFDLNDPDWTDNGDNTASILLSVANGGLSTPLQPGMQIIVPITITVNNCPAGPIVNYAEIADATDENGDPVTDIDSTPDDTNGNDAGGAENTGSDDATGGDGSGNPGDGDATTDEDDHDPEEIIIDPTAPMDFDLALTKVLDPAQNVPVINGDLVNFDITVFNQGDVPADNIEITDYMPSCMTLADPDWTDNGDGTAFILLSVANGGLVSPLAPNAQITVEITLQAMSCTQGTVTNWAEISGATDGAGNPVTDIDSTPDDDQGNDAYMTDNDTSGDGTDDEDDHDPAEVPIGQQCIKPTLSGSLMECAGNVYSITFFNSQGSTVTSSAGTLGATTVTNIPLGVDVTLTATLFDGCETVIIIEGPDTCPSTCEFPELTVGQPLCDGQNFYTVSFTWDGNGVFSNSAGTVSGNTIINIPIGTDVVVTATDGDCVSTRTVESPEDCIDPCENPAISISGPICNADGTPFYSVNFVASPGATVTSDLGTLGNGVITNIPSGQDVTITASITGCPDKIVTVPAAVCEPCVKPVLTLGNTECDGNTYSITFYNSAGSTVTADAGTVGAGVITGIPVGTNVEVIATSSPGCETVLDVLGPTICPTNCEYPLLTVGQPLCDGTNFYEVSFTWDGLGNFSNSAGTISGDKIVDIPIGTDVVVTAANGNCSVNVLVTSPVGCENPCENPAISLSGPICAINGSEFYSVNYTATPGATISVNAGTDTGSAIVGIPSGTDLIITASIAGCADKVVTVPSTECGTCIKPVLTLGNPDCTGNVYSVTFYNSVGSTVSSTAGTVGAGVITNIPVGTDITVTAEVTPGCVTVLDYVGPDVCPVGCEFPELTVGQPLCDGTSMYAVSFTWDGVGSLNASAGVISGTDVINIPIGTDLIMTATDGACDTEVVVPSPEDCEDPCVNPDISISGPICATDGSSFYQINFIATPSATVTSDFGVVGVGEVTNIPSGVDVTVTVSKPGCDDKIVTVPAAECGLCIEPVLTVGIDECDATGYDVTYYTSAGATVTSNFGTVTATQIVNVPFGVTLVVTSEITSDCETVLEVPIPATCPSSCTYPELTVGQPICDGTALWEVSFTWDGVGSISTSAGTISGNDIVGIPVGTDLTVTATDGACVTTVFVAAPEDCNVPCVNPEISVSGPICATDGSPFYEVNYNVTPGSIVTANVGLVGVNSITLVPSGVDLVITVAKTGCPDKIVTVPGTDCGICQVPELTAGNTDCSNGTYDVVFYTSVGTAVSASAGTISGNEILAIPIGVDVVITASTEPGCETVLTVESPATCPTTCEFPELTLGQPICDGNNNYEVSFTWDGNGSLSNNFGTISGNTITNIPIGQNIVLTATDGACVTEVTAASPTDCTEPCINPDISVSGPLCENGSTYLVNFTVSAGVTVTSDLGTVGAGTITGIPSGQDVTITASIPNCDDEVIVVPAAVCQVCEVPVLSTLNVECEGNFYSVVYYNSVGSTVTSSAGTVGAGVITNIPIGVDITITATTVPGCETTINVNAPDTCPSDCEFPNLTVGQPICDGVSFYEVSFTWDGNGTFNNNAGIVGTNTIFNIPIGTDLIVTAIDGACVAEAIVESPTDCDDPCVNPAISISGPECAINGSMTYTVNYTASAGATVTSNLGTVSAGSISGIPSGQDVTITVTLAGCDDKVVVVPAADCSQTFDLALVKTLASGQSANVPPGSSVTFEVSVFNQGEVAADNIEIIDYMPSCATLNDPAWTDNGNGTASIVLSVANGGLTAPLAPNQMVSVPITLDMNSCTGTVTNWAEISDATDGNGNPVTDVDSTPDETQGNDTYTTDNDTDNTNGDEDDHDPESVTIDPVAPDDFDLALIKTVSAGQTLPVGNGDLITFDITVFNQGDIAADNIDIIDYMPSCMTLADGLWTDNGDGTASQTLSVANGALAAPLQPGGQVTTTITLQLVNCTDGSVTNWAEITDATDGNGDPVTDVDSTPDDTLGNDPYGDNDQTDGNGTDDEDDSDPETIQVQNDPPPAEFDLALIKVLAPGQSMNVMTGDFVDYEIFVINQGNVPADNIDVIDYIPSCFTLADPDWTDNGNGTASITISTANGFLPNALLPGNSVAIPLTLQAGSCSGTSQTNWAEITDATDDNGDPVTDVDSTPDDMQGNDPYGDDDQTDGNGTDDEDDHDPETVNVQDELEEEFDLALTKTLPPGNPSTVPTNSVITFNITVFNQGTVSADNIEVTDYMPPCSSLSDANWTDNGDNTASIFLSVANGDMSVPLAPGQQIMIPITLDFSGCAAGPHVNYAEISDATDENGNPVSDVDSTPDDTNGNDAGGEEGTGSDDATGGDGSGNPGDGSPSTDEDDHDPEEIIISPVVDPEFDLALTKGLAMGQSANVANGDVVVFEITVYNQGNVAADDIEVVDYLPACLTLNDPTWFYDAVNHEAVRVISVAGGDMPGPLQPGQSISVPITVIVDGCAVGEIVNWAEIEDFTDGAGNPATDIDSTPDDDQTNDEYGTDNQLDGDGTDDEDDHDPEFLQVMPEVPSDFDLALIKILAPGQLNEVQNGDFITFRIQVTNQGDVAADNIGVIDYIPSCLTLADAQWTDNGDGTASAMLSVANGHLLSPLTPGQSTYIDIRFQVGMTCVGGDHINWAEITEATDGQGDPVTDIDSTPDDDQGNDAYGEDNETDGNGIDDEDDHDPEVFVVTPVFDLALQKVVVSSGPYDFGDDVTFHINVFNQGNIPADNIEITDYMPTGYVFNAADNPGWTNNGDGTLTYVITNVLAPQDNTFVPLVLELTPSADQDWVNYAEISDATDENGVPQDDDDSQMDNFPDNDNPVEPGDENDDEINESPQNPGEDDEDDHDPAVVDVFDLAQIKTTTDEGPFRYGDVVTYTITVYNQGNVPASNVVVNDFLPCGLKYLSSNDGTWSYDAATSTATTTMTGIINPGASSFVTIELEVDECLGDTAGWTNYSEIESATDDEGNPQDDSDSDPDDDPTNDGPVTDDEVDGDPNDPDNPDEDDHDPETIEVFDLALRKTVATAGPYAYGDVIEFSIEVINQGNVDAYNTVISDYIPSGYAFDNGMNVGWTYFGGVAEYTVPFVAAGTTQIVPIRLELVETTSGGADYFNGAEISNVDDDNDPSNDPPTDADSDPDGDPNNDNPVNPGDPNDDVVDEDPNDPNEDDEDDADPAAPEFFDLALIKQPNVAGPIQFTDIIPYTITVVNQGTITATNVSIVDYLPCGLEYVNSNDALGWSYNAGLRQATMTIAGPIEPAASVQVTLFMEVVNCSTNPHDAWTNYGEITGAEDEDGVPQDDIDSNTDNDPNNDSGGDVETDDDDNISGDGTQGEDEDDHDPARIEVYDLALTKKSTYYGIDSIGPFVPGDIVEFEIDVYNQGNVDAYDVLISDYLNAGYAFDPGINPGWTQVPGNLIQTTIAGPFVPGAHMLLKLRLEIIVPADADFGDWYNEAEISGGNNEDGEPQHDVDSYPDNDPDNDNDLVDGPDDDEVFNEGDDNDNEINEDINDPNGEGDDDEDDNDAAEVIVVGDLCGYVWEDCNGDGVNNDGNNGIAGVQVDIYDEMGAYVGSALTDISGYYVLENLFPGNYYVKVNKPDEYEMTDFRQGTVLELDSDLNNSNGLCTTPLAYVRGGKCNPGSWDAGLYKCIPIGERVWYDINENDLFDGFENGINGLPVELWRLKNGTWELYETILTGHKPGTPSDDGYFKFCAPPGTYEIRIDLPGYGLVPAVRNEGPNGNMSITAPGESLIDSDLTFDQRTGAFTVDCNTTDLCNIGAGYYPQAMIGNRVWLDSNQDGLQSTGENGIQGVTVQAFDADDQMINSDVTDANGEYMIDYLGKNDYYLKFTPPATQSLTMTSPNMGDEMMDSDVDGSNGLNTTAIYSLNPGDELPYVDAGFFAGSVVPVEWLSFTGENRGNFNQLDWSTASEVNSSHFEIERSINNTTDFVEIGKVIAAGNSSTVETYDARDYDIEQGGTYYYRLKQVDLNGEFSYSKTISIRIEGEPKDGLELYPNPAVDEVNLDIEMSREDLVNVSIWDASGKMLRGGLINRSLGIGSHTEKLNVTDLPAGMYTLVVKIGNTGYNKKLVVIDGQEDDDDDE